MVRQHLYAFDMLLHQIAKERFDQYRQQVFAHVTLWSYPDDSRRAFASGQTGVWLTENWYDPEENNGEIAWWAGPVVNSSVRIRRNANQKFLKFNVSVVNGINYGDISVRSGADHQDLEIIHVMHPEYISTYYLPIEQLGLEADLSFVVPNCFAPIMTTEADDTIVCRSFLSSNWQLLDVLPVEAGHY